MNEVLTRTNTFSKQTCHEYTNTDIHFAWHIHDYENWEVKDKTIYSNNIRYVCVCVGGGGVVLFWGGFFVVFFLGGGVIVFCVVFVLLVFWLQFKRSWSKHIIFFYLNMTQYD